MAVGTGKTLAAIALLRLNGARADAGGGRGGPVMALARPPASYALQSLPWREPPLAPSVVDAAVEAELGPAGKGRRRWPRGLAARVDAVAASTADVRLARGRDGLRLTVVHPSAGTLVVAPASVLAVWRAQLARYAPTLRVALLQGPARERVCVSRADVVLTPHNTLTAEMRACADKAARALPRLVAGVLGTCPVLRPGAVVTDRQGAAQHMGEGAEGRGPRRAGQLRGRGVEREGGPGRAAPPHLRAPARPS